VTEIRENLTPTKRMLERLEADPYFQVENLNNPDALVPVIFWVLCVRAPNEAGKMELIKGPHYQKSALKIRDAIDSDGARFFRIEVTIYWTGLDPKRTKASHNHSHAGKSPGRFSGCRARQSTCGNSAGTTLRSSDGASRHVSHAEVSRPFTA
jgi:hypothetical protein